MDLVIMREVQLESGCDGGRNSLMWFRKAH